MRPLFSFLLLFLSGVNGDGCWEKFQGVCVSMMAGYCPFTSGGFSWIGCEKGEICCFPGKQQVTEPPQLETECGVPQVGEDGDFRIVGGENATFGEWPWIVSIEYTENYDDPHQCGAALLNDRWVITASHCFMDSQNPQHYRAVIGQHDRSQRNHHEQHIPVEIVLTHGSFNNPYKANDIALVRLSRPVKVGRYAQPICLPSPGEKFEGQICTVVGWGVTNMYSTEQKKVLQEVNVPVLAHDHCQKKVFPFYDSNLCAGYKFGRKDACGGDSGGPLVCKPNGTKRWKLAGIISWGNGCARPENPGVYTKVVEYLDWIAEKTNDE